MAYTYKVYGSQQPLAWIDDTSYDEIRNCASLQMIYRYNQSQIASTSSWECYEYKKNEFIPNIGLSGSANKADLKSIIDVRYSASAPNTETSAKLAVISDLIGTEVTITGL